VIADVATGKIMIKTGWETAAKSLSRFVVRLEKKGPL